MIAVVAVLRIKRQNTSSFFSNFVFLPVTMISCIEICVAAILDGRKYEIVLHAIIFHFSNERNCIVPGI